MNIATSNNLAPLCKLNCPGCLAFHFKLLVPKVSCISMSHMDRALVPGPEVIKLFSCSTQLSMKFFLLINVKMLTFVGILTFMSRKNSI